MTKFLPPGRACNMARPQAAAPWLPVAAQARPGAARPAEYT